MTAQRLSAIHDWFCEKEYRLTVLKILDKFTALTGYAAYIILEIFLFVTHDERLLRCTVVPSAAFVLTTVIRSGINAPRPYEKYDIKPLIPKNTKGNSFPSRHTACICIITAAWYYVNIPAGIFLTIVSLVIMTIRPLAGVHFPRDVIAGAVLSVVCGIAGFIII